MAAEQILARAKRIRLPISALARQAGLNLHTVHRLTREQTDPRCSTVEKVQAALETEERGLLEHLKAIHTEED